MYVQRRQETVSITPQLDLERNWARVSPHFRLSTRARSMFPVCAYVVTQRCRYACTYTGMNVSAVARTHSSLFYRQKGDRRARGWLNALSATAIPRRGSPLQRSHNRMRGSVVFGNAPRKLVEQPHRSRRNIVFGPSRFRLTNNGRCRTEDTSGPKLRNFQLHEFIV